MLPARGWRLRAIPAPAALPPRGYRPVNVLGEWIPLAGLAQCVVAEGARRGLDVAVDAPAEPLVPVPLGRSRLDDEGFERQRDLRTGIRELLDYFLADRPV